MNIVDIESNLKDLVDRVFAEDCFPFEFLSISDVPKATITKLK